MSKKIIYILLLNFIWTTNLFSQNENIEELQIEKLFFGSLKSTPEMVKFVNGVENKRVLNFNRKLLEKYPDTIKSPANIKFVSVGYYSAEELDKNIEALQQFPNLEYLEIKTAVQFRKTDIKDTLVLPEILKQLPKLKYLELSGTYHLNYQDLFLELQEFSSLEYLGMPHSIEDVQIPQSFLKFKNLKGVKISGFKKFIFPNNMGAMDNLESVVLPAEAYENISEELLKFSTLPALKNLSLSFVKFSTEDLHPFQKFSKLERLYLSNFEMENVQDLVDNISQENNLKELSLENLKSNKGISDYSKLKHLEKLHISSYSDYKISLHESLYNLKNLKSLTVHTDSLFSISEKLGGLKNLEELNLSYNNIGSLPAQIGELKKLRYLILRNNRIGSLPTTISDVVALELLDLGDNNLSKLPENFGNLSNLKMLDLSNNNLEELPATFGNLKKLEILHLHINYLHTLPVDIGNLTSLIRLNLDDNFLKLLPASFSRLKELQYLQLGFNHLEELPDDFGDLKELEELYLGGNKNNSRPSSYNVGLGYNVDDSRPLRLFNEIRTFPQSFSKLENLKRIYLPEMTTLDGKALFEVFFKSPSQRYKLEISKTGISSLPQKGWENFLGISLDMGGNVISKIPADIVHAPYLSELRFKMNENDGLSYNLRGKAELNAFYEEQGFIDFSSLPKTEEMAKAYLNNAYNRKYTAEKNILELINKAFLLDSVYTENNLRSSDYADALLKEGEYKKAIKYYDIAIAKDTARGPYILNFILPNFKNRAVAHLAVGDTLAAIRGLEYASQRFSSGDWAKAALLARTLGKDSLASGYFKKGEQFYRDYIQNNLEEDRVDYGYQLSLLELYIVEEDLKKASNYNEQLKREEISEINKQLLLEYLGQVVAILQDKAKEEDLKALNAKILEANVKITSWSFDLLKTWLELSNLDKTKVDKIRSLTVAMENKG